MSMSDRKPDLDPGDPLNYAPRRLREPNEPADPMTVEFEKVDKALSAMRTPYENLAPLPPVRGQELRSQQPPDIFADALARAEREQFERELIEAPELLPSRRSMGIFSKFMIAVAAAAAVALIYVVVFPSSLAPVEDGAPWGLPALQALRSSLFPASPYKPTPTLQVHDNSGPVNESLELGVSVEAATPGMTVVMRRVPPGARLTAGRRVSATEWRVPAQDISDAAISPPPDFVGEVNLSAELRGVDQAPLVATDVRLTWTAPVTGAVATAPVSAAVVAAVPPAPTPAPEQPPQPQVVASLPPAPAVVAPPPARADPLQDLSPNEIAGFVRRAQELLANGDLQAARVQLMRAASARDARAALLLAKTFDPMALKQYSTADPAPDLAQARNWYQRAKEWGAPEAQRQLDALASYPRR
jgi:hypothetical protein